MACGCNKSKSTTTVNSTTKKVDTSAAQRKVAQNLPLVTVKKPLTTTIPAARSISKRQK
jgi:hypothetical protein